jgi:hypothetical protein
MSDLSPEAVAARLAELRAMSAPLGADEARRAMEDPAGRPREPFAAAVTRRLGELRALLELTRHLHEATGIDRSPPSRSPR